MSANRLRNSRILAGQSLCIPRNVRPAPVPAPVVVQPIYTDNNGIIYDAGVYPDYNGGYPSVYPPTGPLDSPTYPYNNPLNTFPCTKTYFNESNLCILQPYPVKVGSTAYAVWNISNFSYGEFDKGDGQGFVGPIAHEQQVGIPNVTSPRLIQLRWKDTAGNWHADSFTIQVTP